MVQKDQKQYAGVWMDNGNAIIITKDHKAENADYAILEKVKFNTHHGGGNEHAMNNAKHTDELKYFKSVSAHLIDYDGILIFGTGKIQEKFQNHLKEDMHFHNKKITIDSSENLTDPQMIAKVRDFFK